MVTTRIPVATYRIQFNKTFRFKDAINILTYLHQLGISDLYTSPILKARIGSMHGYDVTDPTKVNPELGTKEELKILTEELTSHGMGLLLDIVPNHMAISTENPWWMDLLENGLCSKYASFFDINWTYSGNRIVLPVLNSFFTEELKNHKFAVKLKRNGLFLYYRNNYWPLNIKSYRLLLQRCLDKKGKSKLDSGEISQIQDLIYTINGITDNQSTNKQYQNRQTCKKNFLNILNNSSKVTSAMEQVISVLPLRTMQTLLDEQSYRLVFWKAAQKEINYRRFFDINELIGIGVEEPEVYAETHSLILQLIKENKISGLRIDHIDGLKDPLQYLIRLQKDTTIEGDITNTPQQLYLIVEKIMANTESLPSDWPVFGTTGYDFINIVNAFSLYPEGLEALNNNYNLLTQSILAYTDIAYNNKKLVMRDLFSGELSQLGESLIKLSQMVSRTSELMSLDIKNVITEITACMPVYRTYINETATSPRDRKYLEDVLKEAEKHSDGFENNALQFLKNTFILYFSEKLTTERSKIFLKFLLRWQQLTGAIMAKGVEDTALYNYYRLISLNEVGGTPDSSGFSIYDFHHQNILRHQNSIHSLNATSTHDTKRSEDVRARINVISEIADEWDSHLNIWIKWNSPKKIDVNGLKVPDINTELCLYQTIVGAWPLHKEEIPDFKKRLKLYMVKAVREAKENTSWQSPNLAYEKAINKFIECILEESNENTYLEDLLSLQKQIAYFGALNSLSQVMLKITCPGVPDFYQGTELWDFSLVDPDNRRPIDFIRRKNLLNSLIELEKKDVTKLVSEILHSWTDGRIKLYITYKALETRRALHDVFRYGEYLPCEVIGKKKEHLCAFIRHWEHKWALVVIPRWLTKLVSIGEIPIGDKIWHDNMLCLPDEVPEEWVNVFTKEYITTSTLERRTSLSTILATFPVALYISC